MSLIHWQQFLWLFLPQRGLSGCYLDNLKNGPKTCLQLTHGYRARNSSLVCIILHPDCNYYRPAKTAWSLITQKFLPSPLYPIPSLNQDGCLLNISHIALSQKPIPNISGSRCLALVLCCPMVVIHKIVRTQES